MRLYSRTVAEAPGTSGLHVIWFWCLYKAVLSGREEVVHQMKSMAGKS